MTRCDLACGHTSFALPSEARQVRARWWFCWPCGRFVAIVKAEPLSLGPPSAQRKRRRPRSTRTFVE